MVKLSLDKEFTGLYQQKHCLFKLDGDWTKWRKADRLGFDRRVIGLFIFKVALVFKKRERWPWRWIQDHRSHCLGFNRLDRDGTILQSCGGETAKQSLQGGTSLSPQWHWKVKHWAKKDPSWALRSSRIFFLDFGLAKNLPPPSAFWFLPFEMGMSIQCLFHNSFCT